MAPLLSNVVIFSHIFRFWFFWFPLIHNANFSQTNFETLQVNAIRRIVVQKRRPIESFFSLVSNDISMAPIGSENWTPNEICKLRNSAGRILESLSETFDANLILDGRCSWFTMRTLHITRIRRCLTVPYGKQSENCPSKSTGLESTILEKNL